MAELQPDWPLLERFLAGECSPAEAERVQRWLDEHPESAAALDALREAVDRQAPPDAAPPVWDANRAWARLAATTRADAGARYRLPPPLRRAEAAESERPSFNVGRALRPAVSFWLRAAAVLVLLGSGVAGAVLWRSARTLPAPVASSASPRVVTTQRTERADLRLADGTRVVLAPESRLTIPVDFDGTRRAVTLEGEGYFEVVHDTTKPFLVRASHGLVHDLGTGFSVRAYPGESAVQVVVTDGRVAVGHARSTLPLGGPVLVRGDLARLDTTGAATVTRDVDIDRYLSWTEGRLRFVAATLREVLPQLTRWYDVEFELADPALGDRRLTLTLRDEPLAQVLSAVALVTNARYERTGRVVRFIPFPATPPSRAP